MVDRIKLEPKVKHITLKWVANRMLELAWSVAEELANSPKVNKDTIAYMEQLNTLIDKILLMKWQPTVIKKDIKQTIKTDWSDDKVNVNDILDVYAKQNEK